MLQQNINLIEGFLNSENEQNKKDFNEPKYLYLIENGFLSVLVPISLKVKIPTKKAINTDWILNKLNIENTFKNINDLVNKHLNLLNISCFNVYSASYGLGIFCLYNREQPEQIKKVEDYLKSLNVDYKNEFSLKGWVYRFKISKSGNNLNKLMVIRE